MESQEDSNFFMTRIKTSIDRKVNEPYRVKSKSKLVFELLIYVIYLHQIK